MNIYRFCSKSTCDEIKGHSCELLFNLSRSQSGPFHQRQWFKISEGEILREIQSAGFSLGGIYCHFASVSSSCIRATRFATKARQVDGCLFKEANITVQSV